MINVELESWHSSDVVRSVAKDYRRLPVREFNDRPAQLTARQGVFYRNLIRIAEATGRGAIPVDFRLASGKHVYLDRGCIKIAEHAGFIRPLVDSSRGVVDEIHLAWTV